MKKTKGTGPEIPANYLEEFGLRIKEVRQSLGIVQRKFAEQLGVSSSFISEIENGKNKPGLFFLKRLSDLYNISMDYILNGVGQPFFSNKTETSQSSDDLGGPLDMERFNELYSYMKRSPYVKFAILAYFSDFLYKNRNQIQEDIEKHKKHLENLKRKEKRKK